MRSEVSVVRPDSKGRITLGNLAKGVSSFRVSLDKKNRIVLEPFAEIPAREKWLFANKKALAAVLEGLQQSAKGQTVPFDGFSAYVDDDTD